MTLRIGVRRTGLVALVVIEVGVARAVVAGWVVQEEIAECQVGEC